MKIKILFMSCLILLLGIGVYTANENQKTIVRKNPDSHEETKIIAEKLPKARKKSDVIVDGPVGTVCFAVCADDEAFRMSKAIVYGTVTDVYSFVTTGEITTVANVKVKDSIKGVLKKGDEVSIEVEGGYARIEQMIKSYRKEERERVRNWEYKKFTNEEIKNKYAGAFYQGSIELQEGMEGVFSLMPSEIDENIYYTPKYYGFIYMKLPNGAYRKPGGRSYDEMAEMCKMSEEELEQKLQKLEKNEGYRYDLQFDLITYEEIMEKINWALYK